MTKKELFRSVVFMAIVAVMFIILCDLFEQENNKNFDKRIFTYRTLEEDTVDAVYIGTSGVDRYWIAAKAYEEYGMTVYPMSVEQMPAWLFIPMIEESLEYQSPELIILDVRAFTQSQETDEMEIRARRILDAMDLFSLNRLKTAFRTMESIHKLDEEKPLFDVSYLLSFVKYHSMIMEESYRFENNIGSKVHEYAGFYMDPSLTIKVKEIKPCIYKSKLNPELDKITEEALYEVLDYIEEKDLKVLFVDSPQQRSKVEAGRTETIYSILEERGMDYLSYYTKDNKSGITIDFDYKKDFYGEGHVNYYGAEKFTAEMAKYLDENYDLPDRREDENAKKYWDGVYDKIKDKVKEYEEKKNKKT